MPPLMLQIRLCLLYWRPFERPQLIEGLPSETSAGIGPSSTTLYVGNISNEDFRRRAECTILHAIRVQADDLKAPKTRPSRAL